MIDFDSFPWISALDDPMLAAGNPWDSDLSALASGRMDPWDPTIPVDLTGSLARENGKAVPGGTGTSLLGKGAGGPKTPGGP